ncbi:MAG: hypothetical protein IK045_02915 [Bacteroidales bacterium]|nr:hypothetical protein [Bacteroidales bacterium]
MKASVIRGIAATVLLFAALSANAQIRTGGDIDSGTFIMGLDNYFCGAAGGLNFNIGSDTISVSLNGGLITVTSNGSGDEPVEQTVYNNGLVVPFVTGINLPQIYGDFVVGIHDFTGDNVPELVLGVRNASAIGLEVYILKLKEEGWGSIGEVAVFGIAGVECRIFRHTITVKNLAKGSLYTWTCHNDRFDFKASDGTKDPAQLIELPEED